MAALLGVALVACGQPTGVPGPYAGPYPPNTQARAQQAGIAAAGPSSAAQTRIRLQAKLKELTNRRQQDLSQLETLPAQIAEAQGRVAVAQAQTQNVTTQGVQRDSAQDYDYLIGQQDRRDEEARLGQQIQLKEKQYSELNQTYQWQSSGGYFSPANVVSSEQVSAAGQELQNLRDRYLALQREDAQASANHQATQNWQALQRSRLEEQVQQNLSEANKDLQKLSTRYQKFQQDAEQARVEMGNIEDELRSTRAEFG